MSELVIGLLIRVDGERHREVKVRVRLFALARQLAGAGTVEVSVPESATVRDVKEGLVRTVPAFGGLVGRMLIAVNAEYADDTTPVTSSSEIACIPPVSGGRGE